MDKSMNTLSGKRIVVLGASSGLGLATAQAAAAEGAAVVIVSGNAQRLGEARKTLPANAESHVVDLSAEANIERFFTTLGAFDHLVYCAGENISLGDLAATDIASAREFFTLRYWGAVAAVKYGAPQIRQGGSIVLTSGIASKRPGKGWFLGASICGAMDSFVKAMAVELAPIRVNLVSPGVVKTNLWNSLSEADRNGLYNATAAHVPVKYVAEPNDIALTYLYLMKQPYGTGQGVVVDGGATLV